MTAMPTRATAAGWCSAAPASHLRSSPLFSPSLAESPTSPPPIRMATAPPSTTSPRGATGAAETSSAMRRPVGTAPLALAPRTAPGRSRVELERVGASDRPPPAFLPRPTDQLPTSTQGGPSRVSSSGRQSESPYLPLIADPPATGSVEARPVEAASLETSSRGSCCNGETS